MKRVCMASIEEIGSMWARINLNSVYVEDELEKLIEYRKFFETHTFPNLTEEEYRDEKLAIDAAIKDCNYELRHYTPSATNGDYSPSCPWNAPGMSIRDFI